MKNYGSANIKIALLIMGVILIIATLIYTQVLVSEILDREREVANLYAKSIEFIANDQNTSSESEYNFIFDNIIKSNTINFPIVVTDARTGGLTYPPINLELDTTLSKDDMQKKLRKIIKEMDDINNPIKVAPPNSPILSYVHYGQSMLVTRLKFLPFIEIFVAGIFIFFGYFGFNYIKRTEQSNIWVGLSKETAHQLGTPLSSLMGWNELIKANVNNSSKVQTLSNEMSNDLDRLAKIAHRFSKIGSKPDLKFENVHDVIEKVINYFNKRIPRISTGSFQTAGQEGSSDDNKKKIKLELVGSINASAQINNELFEWVIENLTKNALDAIESSAGTITYNIQDRGNQINIDITDNGKGLDMHYKKDIFRPGYSTKQRGWGLGLSLAKRIIDNYHGGKLTVKDSLPGVGTTFRIRLNKKSV